MSMRDSKSLKYQKMVLIFILLLFISIEGISAQNSIFYAKRLPEGQYYTRGIVPLSLPPAKVSAILSDFAHYSRWALKGLDGKDPVSRKHIGIFKNVVYRKKEHKVILIYDINLFWPFGSKNNEFPLDIVSMKYEHNRLKSYTLSYTKPGPTINSMLIKVSIIDREKLSAIDISCTTDFTWLIDPIMSVKQYKKSIGGRIMILGKNIEAMAGQ